MKALGLRPRAFICFSVFGTRDKALALVFDILRQKLVSTSYSLRVSKILLQQHALCGDSHRSARGGFSLSLCVHLAGESRHLFLLFLFHPGETKAGKCVCSRSLVVILMRLQTVLTIKGKKCFGDILHHI